MDRREKDKRKIVNYILANYQHKSLKEISQNLNLKIADVKKIYENLGIYTSETKYFLIGAERKYILTFTDYLISFILFIAALSLYVYTMTPGIAAGDCGELTCAVYFLGGAHSPGYPLYCIVGKLFMGLFFFIGRIVYRLTFFSAFGGALTVALSYLFFVKFLGRYHYKNKYEHLFLAKIPAIAAAAYFLVSDDLWAQAVIAEVYTLNALFLPMLFLIGIVFEERVYETPSLLLSEKKDSPYYWNRVSKLIYLFYFIFGVSVGDHHIILGYLVPFTLFFIYSYVNDKDFRNIMILITIAYLLVLIEIVYFQLPDTTKKTLLILVLLSLSIVISIMFKYKKTLHIFLIGGSFLILGLLVYAYMPIRSRANAPLDWGNPETFQRFITVVTRKQYRGFAQNARSIGVFLHQAYILFKWRLEQFTPWLYIFTFLGLYRLYKVNRKWFFFTLSFLLYYDIAFMQFNNFKFTQRDLFFAEVFFIPSYIVNLIWILWGLEYFMVLAGKYLVKGEIYNNRKIGWGISIFLIGLTALPFTAHYDANNVRHAWANDNYGKNLLKTLEYKSILFTEGGDNQVFSLLYHTYVEHLRPDVNIYDQKGNVFLLYGDMMHMTPQQVRNAQVEKDHEKYLTGRPIYYTWKDYWRINEINRRYNGDYTYQQTGILYKIIHKGHPFNPPINYWLYYDFAWEEYPDEAIHWDYLSREIIANYNFQFGDYYMEKARNVYMEMMKKGISKEKKEELYKKYKELSKKAFHYYRQAQIFGFDMTAIHYNLGILLENSLNLKIQNKEWNEVKKTIDEAIKDYLTAAALEVGQGNAPRAYFAAARAYEREATLPVFLTNNTSLLSNALKYYNEALKISPNFRDAIYGRERVKGKLRYPYKLVMKKMEELKKNPKNKNLYFEILRMRIARNEINEGIALLKEGLKYFPQDLNFIYNIANIYFQINRPKEAIYYFKKMVKINPNEVVSYFYLGESYFRLKEYKKAFNYFQTFLNMAPRIRNGGRAIQNMIATANNRLHAILPYIEQQ